jgi:hypothetical protein
LKTIVLSREVVVRFEHHKHGKSEKNPIDTILFKTIVSIDHLVISHSSPYFFMQLFNAQEITYYACEAAAVKLYSMRLNSFSEIDDRRPIRSNGLKQLNILLGDCSSAQANDSQRHISGSNPTYFRQEWT